MKIKKKEENTWKISTSLNNRFPVCNNAVFSGQNFHFFCSAPKNPIQINWKINL